MKLLVDMPPSLFLILTIKTPISQGCCYSTIVDCDSDGCYDSNSLLLLPFEV